MKGVSAALVTGLIAFTFKVFIPKLLPYGPSQIIYETFPYSEVDETIQTLKTKQEDGSGNLVKIFEREANTKNTPLLVGPETVIIDDESNIYALAKGNIIQLINLSEEVMKDNEKVILADVKLVASTPGFPLGGKFVPKTKILYFADAVLGLCRIDVGKANPKIEIVVSKFQLDDGTWSKIYYADDVDVGSKSGKIYFSDASNIAPERDYGKQYDTMYAYKMDMLRGEKTGRLFSYDPSNDKLELLASDIWFANGVAIDDEETYVVVSETSSYRMLKYFLHGSKKGEVEVLVDNLPGLPDGADCGPSYCYAPLPSSVLPLIKLLDSIPPKIAAFLKTIFLMLPKSLTPKPIHYAGIVEVTPGDQTTPGKINYLYQDPFGKYTSLITGVTEHNGKLYLGSLTNKYIGVLDLNEGSK
jgi:hypothetical protein